MSGRSSLRTVAQRCVPHPAISAVLAGVWLALNNDLAAGTVLLGIVLCLAVPRLVSALWPPPPRILSWRKLFSYVVLVLWDIVVANFAVARVVLFRPLTRMRTHWIAVPLDLRTSEAIAVFAATITLTPGTVSCDLSADGRRLLVHCLDTADPEDAVRAMKARYEDRLKEIFG